MRSLLKRVLGSSNDKALNTLRSIVDEVNALEDEYRALSDEELAGISNHFREQLAAGAELDDILPLHDLFHVCRGQPGRTQTKEEQQGP